MKLTSKQKGVIFLIASAFFFALMNLFIKLSGDLPALQKAFFRNLIAAIIAFVALRREKVKFRIEKEHLPFFILRTLFGTLGIISNFYALKYLLLADASILAKLAPFFIILFSFLFLKEKVRSYQIFAVLAAFSASFLVIKPVFGESVHISAAFIGALGGMAAGSAYTCIRYLSLKGVKGAVIVLFFSLGSSLLLFPFFVLFYSPMTVLQFCYLMCAGFAGAGGQFFVTSAYANAPANSISVFDYTQIIFSALMGFIAFGEIPDRWSLLGFFIIFSIALFMFLHKDKNNFSIKS